MENPCSAQTTSHSRSHLSLIEIDGEPAWKIGMRLRKKFPPTPPEPVPVKEKPPVVIPPPKPPRITKTQDEIRKRQREHMREVRGSTPGYGSQTREQHLEKQRMCMRRLRAEKMNRDTRDMPKRKRIIWKRIINNV